MRSLRSRLTAAWYALLGRTVAYRLTIRNGSVQLGNEPAFVAECVFDMTGVGINLSGVR